MVGILYILAYVAGCFVAARYGRRPARHVARLMRAVINARKLPVLLALFAVMVLWPRNADAGIGDFVANIVTTVGGELTDVVAGMLDAVRAGILQAFADLICLLIEEYGPILVAVIQIIPEEVTDALNAIKPYMDIANSWLPLDFGMAMFGIYIVFLAVQIPTKLIIKIFIPTVG